MGKKLPRIVVDTNVWVLGIVFGGKPKQILRNIIDGQIQVVSSKALLAELAEVLSKKVKYTSEKVEQIAEQLEELVEIVQPRETIEACRDPGDNRVLEAAIEGKCRYVISGDKDLLALKKYKSVRILTPVEFVTYMDSQGD